MTEKQLGRDLAGALRQRKWSVFKLHNDAMQRGLLDYIAWSDRVPLIGIELKLVCTDVEAMMAMTPGQRSVFNSLSNSPSGAYLVYCCDDSDGYIGGVARHKSGLAIIQPVASRSRKTFMGQLAVALEDIATTT